MRINTSHHMGSDTEIQKNRVSKDTLAVTIKSRAGDTTLYLDQQGLQALRAAISRVRLAEDSLSHLDYEARRSSIQTAVHYLSPADRDKTEEYVNADTNTRVVKNDRYLQNHVELVEFIRNRLV